MDRLAETCFSILARRRPARAPITALEEDLRRDRIAMTGSVLRRSLRTAEGLREIDPWRGANRGLPRAARGPWIVVEPDATTPGAAGPAPGDGPGGSATARVPLHTPPDTGRRIDRGLRTLAARGDATSPCALARWLRLCDEGDAALALAARSERARWRAPLRRVG